MSATTPIDDTLFLATPLRKLQRPLGGINPRVTSKAVLVVLIGWLPLLVLAAMQDSAPDLNAVSVIASDFAVHARFLIAAPLLVLGDMFCTPRLSVIARHFLEAGLIRETDRFAYQETLASIRRLRDSTMSAYVAAALALACVGALIYWIPLDVVPAWHREGTGASATYSLAGWWHVLVSLPLLLLLLATWMWRLCLWTWFLWRVSRFDLQLLPAHPDLSAGLKFVVDSVRAWSIVASALGWIVAGAVANSVAQGGGSLPDYKFLIAGVAGFALVAFIAPLFVFSNRLERERRRAVLNYGALAGEVGRQFDLQWLDRAAVLDETVLEQSHFSAATDLYQIVERVHAINVFLVDRASVFALAAATMLPFVPVALLSVPLDALLAGIVALLF